MAYNRPRAARKYTDKRVDQEGLLDGKCDPSIPPWDAEELPPALREVWQAGNVSIQHIHERWNAADTGLQAAWASAFKSFVHAARAVVLPAQTLARAEGRYEEERQGKAPPTDRRFVWYGAACVALAAAEVPFNEIVFREAGESEILTLVFTVALAGSVIGGAHWAGVMLRRRLPRAAALIASVSLATMGSIAYFRAVHMASAHAAHPAVAGRFDMVPTLFSFTAFNVLLFAVMAIYSYAVHDDLLQEVFAWRRSLDAARRGLRRQHRAFARAYSRRANLHAAHHTQAMAVSANVRRLFECYRKHNLRARKDRVPEGRGYPESYKVYLEPEIPAGLTELSWQAPAEARSELATLSTIKEIADEIDATDPALAAALA